MPVPFLLSSLLAASWLLLLPFLGGVVATVFFFSCLDHNKMKNTGGV